MVEGVDDERYAAACGKAKTAITRGQRAADAMRSANEDRDAHVVEMVEAGGTLGGVARDTGLSKSLVALIWRQHQGALRQAERLRSQG
jgi:hypothetical protein